MSQEFSQDFIKSIVKGFRIPGDFIKGYSYGSGHINDTVAVEMSVGGAPLRFLLQRINNLIFKDIPGLMDNIARVTAQSQKALAEANEIDASRKALTLIETIDGKSFFTDSEGRAWRCYIFIEHATGFDIIETEHQAFEASKAFAEFQKLLVDLPGERLNETIPDFHHTPKRFETLKKAIEADMHNRAAEVKKEIDFFMNREALAGSLIKLNEEGKLPERVTHNDTKLNNVLIDNKTNEASCVIDLDTLMPGLSLYDFGDLVRTSTSPVAEDEKDASKVVMRMNMYESLVEGFLAGGRSFLTKDELDNLHTGGQVITMECGTRFLTDYLQGDTYFKTKYEGHNMVRCRTQIALVESMETQVDAMLACVNKAI